MTACAPLCGLADARRVTSRSPSQTKLCPKRVAGVRHPANSAQLKVAGEPGGRKKCRIKAGGRLCAPRPATPPRRAGRGFSIGGRNFNFLLWQVVGISKSREKTAMFRLFTRWLSQVVFRNFTGVSAGVIFYPLGASRGSVFPLSLQPPQNRRVKAGISARIYVNQKENKNAEQHVSAQHKLRTKIVRSSASPSAVARSSAQKSQPVGP